MAYEEKYFQEHSFIIHADEIDKIGQKNGKNLKGRGCYGMVT